jgi:uncharacterized protein with HEPN domain
MLCRPAAYRSMNDRAPKLLFDAISAIDSATEFLGDVSLDTYFADAMRRSAVERQLEILGEACSRLEKLDAGWSSTIPDIRLAIGLRNRIIHGYDAGDDAMVFETVGKDLPSLRAALAAVMPTS